MINNIKLDDIKTFLDLHKSTVKAAAPVGNADQVGVSVTNQMNQLVNLVRDDQESTKARSLHAIKESIQNDTYRVDLDALSTKMISEGVIS